MKKLIKRKEEGITLIALVITIIVLLILAGITIAQITGQDSAPSKAVEARQRNQLGAIKDEISLTAQNEQMNIYEKKYIKKEYNGKVGEAVISALKEKYNSTTQNGVSITIDDEGNITLTIDSITETGIIDSNDGKITWNTIGQTNPDNPQNPDDPNTPPDPNDTTEIEIGETVNYTTTLNGETLDKWRVFYTEGDKVYLIYSEYLPNAAISEDSFTYCLVDNGYITSNDYAGDVIPELTNKTTFSSLITGQLEVDGETKNISHTSGNDIWAIGTPDIELFVKSWNSKYSLTCPIYIEYSDTDIDDGDYYRAGYFISNSENPKANRSQEATLSGCDGYNDTLYFPYKENMSSYGYWLCSPDTRNTDYVVNVQEGGWLGANSLYLGNKLRPIICLPLSDFK